MGGSDSEIPVGRLEATLDPRTPLDAEAGPLEPERVRAIYEIGRRLLEQREPEAVVTAFREAVIRTLRPDNACLLSLVDGGVRPVFAHGFDSKRPWDTWGVSQTVLRRVRETALAILATDATADDRLRDASSVHALKIRSVLCVPLGSPMRALLYLDRRLARSPFTRADLALLTALSVYANLVLESAEALARTSDELRSTAARWEALASPPAHEAIVGRAPSLLAALDDLARFARQGIRVLLLGETGTGKDLFARYYARQAGKPLVPVAIPTLAPGLVESELFGHVRGSFPGATRDKTGLLEAARDGVLFLDEVGDIEPAIQPKLLRFLESGELRRVGDTRVRVVTPLIVSGTNRPLDAEAGDGRFRADLLARLGHVVRIPPLRERREDVAALVEHFTASFARGRKRVAFAPDALDALQRYSWPLNVRELRQAVERIVCLVDSETVSADHLPDYMRAGSSSSLATAALGASAALPPASMEQVLTQAKKRHLAATLAYTKGNKAEAIRILGISNDTFYRWAKDLDLE
jgi:transcriptional regulator with GAF, ATPase, and Fis domain